MRFSLFSLNSLNSLLLGIFFNTYVKCVATKLLLITPLTRSHSTSLGLFLCHLQNTTLTITQATTRLRTMVSFCIFTIANINTSGILSRNGLRTLQRLTLLITSTRCTQYHAANSQNKSKNLFHNIIHYFSKAPLAPAAHITNKPPDIIISIIKTDE